VKLLAIDTATENCSAALLINGTIHSRELETPRGHADRILTMVDDLLSEAALTLHDLDAIAFGRGPGSFTGVRLGVTVTQGLAFGAGLGVVPISDLRAVAQRAFRIDATLTRVLVCNDARMSEVYWGCFERGGDGLARLEGEEHVSKPGDVSLPAEWLATPAGTAAIAAAGRGFLAYGEALHAAVPTAILPAVPSESTSAPSLLSLLPHATEIALLAAPEIAAGRLISPEEALPTYLRDNVAHVAQPPKPPGQAP
jgi:tRNA threonylcarbamoyladenosine biosynthesis protein TsaB